MSNRSEQCVHKQEQSNDHYQTKLISAEKEFLTSRERLKAKFRKEMAQERALLFGNTATSSPSITKANCANKSNSFGTSFGPSVPSVATRVVKESMIVRAHSSASSQKKRTALNSSENKNSASKKMKIAAQLRYTRDYSFLFTEDNDGTKLSTDPKSVKDDASSKQQPPPPPSKSSSTVVAPPKDHQVKPTSQTDNRNVSHTAQRKGTGTYKQSLPPQCNKKTPIGHCQGEKSKDIKVADNYKRTRRPAKRPFDEDDDTDAIRIIRSMFKYDPSKWEGKEEDDDIMEVNFDAILKEERRSARIAKNEDDEQLQLLQEEEKRKKKRIRLN